MAFALVAAVLLFAASANAQCTCLSASSCPPNPSPGVAGGIKTLIGGATSINNFMTGSISGCKGLLPFTDTATSTSISTYASVGSTCGINGFNTGVYALGFSDDPMNSVQDASTPSGGKLTIPAVLATYTFFTLKKSGLKISGKNIANVYLGTITKWSSFISGDTNTIVPVCRQDGSGTTEIITRYLSKANSAWPANFVGQGSLTKGCPSCTSPCGSCSPFASSLIAASGTGGVVSLVKANVNRIGYAQSGVPTGTFEIGIDNPAGTFLFASSANPIQSIPRQLPPYTASWSSVTLVDAAGAQTYPMASFIYSFIRQKYAGSVYAGNPGHTVKDFLLFIESDATQQLGKCYSFFPLPTSITDSAAPGGTIATIKADVTY